MSDKFIRFCNCWGQFHLDRDACILNWCCQGMNKNILSPECVFLRKDMSMPIQNSVITHFHNVKLLYVNVCFFCETLDIKIRMIDAN